MTVARALGLLGKTVIALGVGVVLFAIFQLWGTGIFEARAQQNLEDEFTELLEESSSLGPTNQVPSPADTPAPTATPEPTPTSQVEAEPSAETASPTPVPEQSSTLETTSGPPEADPAWLAMLYRDKGSAVARIQIPAIGVDKTVVEGVRVSDLRKGPGHYPNSPMPGQAGNVAIGGHRTTYGAPFGEIDELKPGDQVIVTTVQGEFTYEVVEQGQGHGHFIVAPHQVEVLDQDFSENPNRLTLLSCHPKGSARQRIIVVAALVGDPAPTFPRPGISLDFSDLTSVGIDEFADTEQADAATPTPQPSESAEPTPSATDPAESAAPATAHDDDTPPPQSTQVPSEAVPDDTGAIDTGASEALSDETVAVPARASSEAEAGASFGEGIDGDSDGLVPAILWGLAAMAVWFFALFVGRRWRRLPAYALSALPFLAVLFMAFWHLDRVLPSY